MCITEVCVLLRGVCGVCVWCVCALVVWSCRDFLPRGSGIVTRRPLILQLINSKAGECYGTCVPCNRDCHPIVEWYLHASGLSINSTCMHAYLIPV